MNSMILYKPPEALSVPVTHAGGPGSGIRSEVIKPATGHARGLESDLGSTARVRMPSEPTVIRLRGGLGLPMAVMSRLRAVQDPG